MAGIGAWEQFSPHSLRHSAITFALDAGAPLRDVQDYADHKDPALPAATTTPATAWTATPPTPSLPIWREPEPQLSADADCEILDGAVVSHDEVR